MRYRDRVDIVAAGADGEVLTANVPANMGAARTVIPSASTGLAPWTLIESVQVQVPAGTDYDRNQHGIVHNGKRYRADGVPTIAYQHGRAHHMTIPVKRYDDG